MPATPIQSDTAPNPVGPYPHASVVSPGSAGKMGDGEGKMGLVFVSGMGPRRKGDADVPGVTLDAGGNMVDYDIMVQTRAVMENIEAALTAAGSSFDNIVDVAAYLTDMKRDFAGFNAAYAEFFGGEGKPFPSRTTVEVSALPQGASSPIAVELKVIATL